MADVSVLREFLVKIGFDVDKAKFKKFTDSVDTATKRVALVGLAVEAAAATIAAGVSRIADNFSQLYYASQQLHTSAQNIETFRTAFSTVGGTASQAMAALQGVTTAWAGVRDEIFSRRVALAGMGQVTALDKATGQFRDFSEILLGGGGQKGLVEVWRDLWNTNRRPYAIARAGIMGIDPQTLSLLIRNFDTLRNRQETLKADAAAMGLDWKDAAKVGADAWWEFTRVLENVKLALASIALPLMKEWTPKIRAFLDELVKHPEQVQRAIKGIVKAVGGFISWVYKMTVAVGGFFMKLDEATGGLSTKILGVLALLHFTGIDSVIFSLIGLFGGLGKAIVAAISTPWGAALVAAGAFFAGLKALQSDYENWKKTGTSGLGIDWSQYASEIEQINDSLKDLKKAFKDLGDTISQVFAPAAPVLDAFARAWDSMVHSVLTSADHFVQYLTHAINALRAQLKGDIVTAGVEAGLATVELGRAFEPLTQAGQLKAAAYANAKHPWAEHLKAVAARRAAETKAAGGAPVDTTPAAAAGPWAADTSPDAKPSTLTRTMRDLNESVKDLADAFRQGMAGAGGAAGAVGNVLGEAATGLAKVGPGFRSRAMSLISGFKALGVGYEAAMGAIGSLGFETAGTLSNTIKNPRSTAYGLTQLTKSSGRQALFERIMGKEYHGSSFEDQAKFMFWELLNTDYGRRALAGLRRGKTRAEGTKAWTRHFEGLSPDDPVGRPQYFAEVKGAPRYYLGPENVGGANDNRAVHIHQKTDIAVSGVADPHSTARTVTDAQTRVNGNLVRNARTAMH